MEKSIKSSKEKKNLLLSILGLTIFVLIPFYYFLFMQSPIISGWGTQDTKGWLGVAAFWVGVFIHLIVSICRKGTPIKKDSIKLVVILVMIIGILIYSSTPLIFYYFVEIVSRGYGFGFEAIFIGGFGLFIAVMALDLLLKRESENYKKQKKLSIILLSLGFFVFLFFNLITLINIFEVPWIFPLIGLIIGIIGFASWPTKKKEKSFSQ
ncbi:MAG: hypothetical protein ACFFCY_12005 [Promethearchaeota archaeon]